MAKESELTSQKYRSQDIAAEKSHKTITAAHVLDAIAVLDWEDGKEVTRMLNKELKGRFPIYSSIYSHVSTCLLPIAYKNAKTKKAKKAPVASTSGQTAPLPPRKQATSTLQSILDTEAEDDDAESYGEPEEEEPILEEESSEDEFVDEDTQAEVEDQGLQKEDVQMEEAIE